MLNKDEKHVWITKQQLDTLLQPEVLNIYLGLLLAKDQIKPKSKKIKFYKNDSTYVSFDKILVDNDLKINDFKTSTNYEKIDNVLNPASAMPVGSSSIKRNTKFSIMLNAGVGFYNGWRFQAGLAVDIPMFKLYICDK